MVQTLLSVSDAASYAGVTAATIGNYVRKGALIPLRKGIRQFFRQSDIDKAFAEHRKKKEQRERDTKAFLSGAVHSTLQLGTSSGSPPGNSAKDGKLAAQATRLFNKGMGIRDVVIEMQISYESAEHLFGKWRAAGGDLIILAKDLDVLKKRIGWKISQNELPSLTSLLRAIEEHVQIEIDKAVNHDELEHLASTLDAEKKNQPTPKQESPSRKAPFRSIPKSPAEPEKKVSDDDSDVDDNGDDDSDEPAVAVGLSKAAIRALQGD